MTKVAYTVHQVGLNEAGESNQGLFAEVCNRRTIENHILQNN